jgi:hypothetical protein
MMPRFVINGILDGHIVNVSEIMEIDGNTYERIYWLDLDKIDNRLYERTFDHDPLMQHPPGREHTKVVLTFKDIMVSKVIEWKKKK